MIATEINAQSTINAMEKIPTSIMIALGLKVPYEVH